jgi:hypothetical protein
LCRNARNDYGATVSTVTNSGSDLVGKMLSTLPDGVIVVVKRDCATCEMVSPVLGSLGNRGLLSLVASQDDPAFPDSLPASLMVFDDHELVLSFGLDLDTVPTVLRWASGAEVERIVGWSAAQWSAFFGLDLAAEFPSLPAQRPGCGSKTQDIGVPEALAIKFGVTPFHARPIELADEEDEIEAIYTRGWTDGLPVVPPTPTRVLRMLGGTSRGSQEVVAIIPPNLVPCTVEKVAINAVMAGCLPEYFPVVLAAVEAACTSTFNAHGLLATTYFSGPVLVVNGPIAKRIGMNSGVNVFGQGNRANSTIGRALQLVIRNVGGGLPGGVDRATMGNPGKVGFCFAESEEAAGAVGWASLATERGIAAGNSAVTLFAGEGPRAIVDQKSRTAESLVRSFAACLRTVAHPKLPLAFDALVAISPEHLRTFASAGWDRARLREELFALLTIPGAELVQGAGDITEGVPAGFADVTFTKFRPDGLQFVHCGGDAGMFSAVIGGWVNGAEGSEPITVDISPWM